MQSSLRWQRTAGPDQIRALHCRDVSRCPSRARRVSAAVSAEHRQHGRAADRHAAKRRAIIVKDAQISVETGSRDVSASADLAEEVLPDLASYTGCMMQHVSSAACTSLSCIDGPVRSQEVVLVGDIGGTNCRLVLWKIYPGLRDEILFSKARTALPEPS